MYQKVFILYLPHHLLKPRNPPIFPQALLIPGLSCVVPRIFQDLLVTWAGPEPQNPSMGQLEPGRQGKTLRWPLENCLSVLQMAA